MKKKPSRNETTEELTAVCTRKRYASVPSYGLVINIRS